MSDGRPTPSSHDGMAAFGTNDGKVRLVRNHERGGTSGAFATGMTYDPMAEGGTTTLVFDPDAGQFLESRASSAGTIRNCAGGPTPWGSWLTCEETTNINGAFRHGYVFEVPVEGTGSGTPLKAMGRFSPTRRRRLTLRHAPSTSPRTRLRRASTASCPRCPATSPPAARSRC